jgi:SAM-dependent methyltransferase
MARDYRRNFGLDHRFWRFNGPRFLELLPPPGRLTVDVGCGEGRLTRQLAELGHRVIGIESSPTLAAAARESGVDAREADAGSLPMEASTADLVIAFMSLLNLDDMEHGVREVACALAPGGRFCFAVPHPLNSGGLLEEGANQRSYFEPRRFVASRERAGVCMDFDDVHRPLEAYARALADAGLVIEELREPVPDPAHVAEYPEVARWLREPCYLHARALLPLAGAVSVKTPSSSRSMRGA